MKPKPRAASKPSKPRSAAIFGLLFEVGDIGFQSDQSPSPFAVGLKDAKRMAAWLAKYIAWREARDE